LDERLLGFERVIVVSSSRSSNPPKHFQPTPNNIASHLRKHESSTRLLLRTSNLSRYLCDGIQKEVPTIQAMHYSGYLHGTNNKGPQAGQPEPQLNLQLFDCHTQP
jgi:hypothetical protein